jgi:predicted glycoside hydrolase/deacetylase ChbG (UPF0249 family)
MSQTGKACDLLGLPSDSRLVIFNIDDFGMCYTAVESGVRCMQEGVASSCTVMVPCPWGRYALEVLKNNPEIKFGVHLTAITDHPYYRWGPMLAADPLPSLRDETGMFWSLNRIDDFMEQVNPEDLECEFRAQIDAVLDLSLNPTHLDSHCHVHTRRERVFDLVVDLAREYGLAVRATRQPLIDKLQANRYPVPDHPVLDSFDIKTADKPAHYYNLLRELPEGLSEWALHPAQSTAEVKAMTALWDVRHADYEFCMSEETRQIIDEEGIQIVSFEQLQVLWKQKSL